MQKSPSFFKDISFRQFLSDYWQQKPLLIRQAFSFSQLPIRADELAGLAMEDFVESRIVKTKEWQLEHGPFAEDYFGTLPEKEWTLLVQGVDQLVPEVAELLEYFRFLPSWRLDDIMVSYATDGGSVGPHFDHYDVFLIQAEGKRRWQIGAECDSGAELLKDTELAILKEFTAEQEWVLEPGDILYLPPKIAHWGVAEGECLTYSIGFRAPNTQEIVSHFCGDRLANDLVNQYFNDGKLDINQPYLIDDEVIAQVQRLLLEILDDKEALRSWFGRHMTSQRYSELEEENSTPTSAGVERYRINPSARVALTHTQNNTLLFVNGEALKTSQHYAKTICQRGIVELTSISRSPNYEQEAEITHKLIQMNVLQPM